jgi:hypothetical protein
MVLRAVAAACLLCGVLGAEVEVGGHGAQTQSEFDSYLMPRLCSLDSNYKKLDSLVGNLPCQPGKFGSTSSMASGDMVLLDPEDGCKPVVSAIKGKVAVIKRGSCTFYTKYSNAKKAGAVGVLIWDYEEQSSPMILMRDDVAVFLGSGDAATEEDPIPCAALLFGDGMRITEALKAGGTGSLRFSYQVSISIQAYAMTAN